MLDLNLEAAYYDRLRAKDIFQKKKKSSLPSVTSCERVT